MPAEFTVDLRAISYYDVQVSHAVKLTPVRWSASVDGGPDRCEIRASGTEGALADVARMVGCHVTIYNELGSPCWWGYIHEVDLRVGGQSANLSLSEVYNKIAVAYTVRQPDGSERRFTTDWRTWEVTSTFFGYRELLDTLNEGDSTAALALRDRLLAQHARMMPAFNADGAAAEGIELTLHGRGWWELLDVQYYAQPQGLEENAAPRKGTQVLGGYYTNTTISFATVAGEDNDIRDSANGLGALTVGAPPFWVSGAANAENNGRRSTSDFDNAGHIETVEKTLVSESAGAAVTISWAEDHVSAIAQSFVAGASFEVRKLSARIGRTGTTTDNCRLAVYSDSAGNPGTQLCYGGFVGTTLPSEVAWQEVACTTGTVLAAGTTYWFVVTRTGGPSLAGYYGVGVDENLFYTGGVVKVSQAGAWVNRSPDADLPFRVTGLEDTATQIATMLDYATDSTVVAAVQEIESGIETWQYRAGDRTIQDEIRELMAMGTADGRRLCVQMTPERRARVFAIPLTAPEAMRPVLTEDGNLEDAEPGYLPAGRWIRLGAMGMADAIGQDALFVERCEYDAETGKLAVESEATVSAWRALGNRRG